MSKDVLIIGAGAAGLMAAKYLSEKGKQVVICEGRGRTGGRIQTIAAPFAGHTELGAEFVHGNLPLTLDLLKEAGINYYEAGGEWWQTSDEEEEDHWPLFMQKLHDVTEDMTLDALLAKYFSDDQYASLRRFARGYASGFDTADPARVSVIALRDEWLTEEHAPNYRPTGGYSAMTEYMKAACLKNGCELHTNCVVKEINWQKGKATATTADGETYTAKKIIITVPLGVLQSTPGSVASIAIQGLPLHVAEAIQHMGMGAVIKVLLQFNDAFWKSKETAERTGKSREHLGFLLSGEALPTWWTQYPETSTLLTGWLGGPAAAALKDVPDEEILALSLNSLSRIFKLPADTLKQMLTAHKVINWTNDPFSMGSYSYATTATKQAQAILSSPIEDTLYFAGEALYEGKEMGTVEAALSSGLAVSKLIA